MEISNAGENLFTAQETVKPPKFLEELEKNRYYFTLIILALQEHAKSGIALNLSNL